MFVPQLFAEKFYLSLATSSGFNAQKYPCSVEVSNEIFQVNKREQEILLFVLRCLVRKSFEGAVCSDQLLVETSQDNSHFIMS